jgi:hypothetical protein
VPDHFFLRNVTMKFLALSGLSALLIVGFGPLSAEAGAQVFSSQRSPAAQTQGTQAQGTPAQGSTVVQTALERDETLYLDKDSTYDYDLVVRSDSALGGQRLPIGAIIRGRFEPAEGGLVYVANSVELGDRIYQVRATSELLRDRKDPRQTSTGAVLGNR